MGYVGDGVGGEVGDGVATAVVLGGPRHRIPDIACDKRQLDEPNSRIETLSRSHRLPRAVEAGGAGGSAGGGGGAAGRPGGVKGGAGALRVGGGAERTNASPY